MTRWQALELPGNGSEDIQAYARLAGVLGVITLIVGGFGEAYVPGAIMVAGDAAATARNILAPEALCRWGFAAYLVEAFCDVGLAMAFWVLFRPAHRNVALLMVLFRVISTAGFAGAQVLWFGALRALGNAEQLASFTPDQLDALAFALLGLASFGGALFTGFYGVASLLLGWLILRSGLIPKILGVLMAIMGAAFVLQTFLVIVAPAYASPLLLAVAIVAFLPLTFWLLVKGVDVARWQELTARRVPQEVP